MKSPIAVALVAVVVVALAACSTPYKPNGIMGGFDELQLGPGQWRVSFRGNGYTSERRAEDYCTLRACELVLTNGFTHFVLVTGDMTVRRSTTTTPGYASSSGYVSGQRVGNAYSGNYYGSTYYSPPQTHEVEKPLCTFYIHAFHSAPPPEVGFAFDAALLQRQLRAKYSLDR